MPKKIIMYYSVIDSDTENLKKEYFQLLIHAKPCGNFFNYYNGHQKFPLANSLYNNPKHDS